MIRTLLTVTLAAAAACGKKDAPSGAKADTTSGTAASPPKNTAVVQTQGAPSDPCGWISQADAEKALGEPLTGAPTRVRSSETPVDAPDGSACRYDLASTGLKRSIAISLTPDESGVMQSAFMGMGSVEPEFKGSEAQGDTLIDGHWDFMSAIPGGLTAAGKGRIAVLVSASVGTGDLGMALAGAMVDRIPDLPFTEDPADPAVAPQGPDPCALITRQEAEAVLGPLAIYRSRKATALVYGSGPSCTYFTGKHRALVVTPTWRLGREMFSMLGGARTLVASKLGGTDAPDTLEGSWDQLATTSAGALLVLKGDKMLTIQFKSSGANLDKTIALVRAAMPRF